MKPNLPFLLVASNAILRPGGPLKWKKRLVKDVRLSLPLTEAMKIAIRGDDVVLRASALQSVDLGFIPFVELYQKTSKTSIHSFPAWRSAFKKDGVDSKPESLLVAPLGKALNGTSLSLCGRQVVHPHFTGLQL